MYGEYFSGSIPLTLWLSRSSVTGSAGRGRVGRWGSIEAVAPHPTARMAAYPCGARGTVVPRGGTGSLSAPARQLPLPPAVQRWSVSLHFQPLWTN